MASPTVLTKSHCTFVLISVLASTERIMCLRDIVHITVHQNSKIAATPGIMFDVLPSRRGHIVYVRVRVQVYVYAIITRMSTSTYTGADYRTGSTSTSTSTLLYEYEYSYENSRNQGFHRVRLPQ